MLKYVLLVSSRSFLKCKLQQFKNHFSSRSGLIEGKAKSRYGDILFDNKPELQILITKTLMVHDHQRCPLDAHMC